MVHGLYHVCKDIIFMWCAALLPCTREVENHRDPFTVAVLVVRSGVIVDHILLMFLGPAKSEMVCI